MATDICFVTLTGRLTRDAELRYAQNGSPIVRFSIAVNRGKRNADGSWGEEATFFECSYFGKSAEAVNAYLTKGTKVCVMGDLRHSRWEGNDGQTRYRLEVTVNQLTLTGGTARNGEGSAADLAMRQGGGSGYNSNAGGYNNNNAGGNYNSNGNSSYGSNNAGGNYSGGNYSSSQMENSSYTRQQQAQARPQVSGGPEDFKDDDIPF